MVLSILPEWIKKGYLCAEKNVAISLARWVSTHNARFMHHGVSCNFVSHTYVSTCNDQACWCFEDELKVKYPIVPKVRVRKTADEGLFN